MNNNYRKLLAAICVLLLSACGSSGDDENDKDNSQNGYQAPELINATVITDAVSNSYLSDFGCTGYNSGSISDTAVESENFIVVTSSVYTSSEDEMHLLATYAELALEEQLTRYDISASDLNIHDSNSKVLVCSDDTITNNATGSYEGVNYYGVNGASVSSIGVTYNPNSSFRETLKHEISHTVDIRLSSIGAESKGIDRLHRWMSEGLAEVSASRNESYAQATYSIVSERLSGNGGRNPLDDTFTYSNTKYELYLAAVKYLITPVNEGGAGNILADIVSMFQLMKTTAQGLNDYHIANYGHPIDWRCEYNFGCYEEIMYEYLGEEISVFEYAFQQTFTKDGLPLTYQELRDNFYDGELWYISFLNR